MDVSRVVVGRRLDMGEMGVCYVIYMGVVEGGGFGQSAHGAYGSRLLLPYWGIRPFFLFFFFYSGKILLLRCV